MNIQAVIFDLDGVIVSTDELHYQAWLTLAEKIGLPFDRHVNERLRGVSRMESLEIILESWPDKPFTDEEKHAMAEQKNDVYRRSLSRLKRSDILPGVLDILNSLKQRGIRTAIGSSSRNATTILSAVGLNDQFDAVVDGTHIRLSKPDPEVFLLAAQKLEADPANCLVVEDADAGVEAAKRAGMRVLGVGPACHHPASTLGAADLTSITIDEMLSIHSGNTE